MELVGNFVFAAGAIWLLCVFITGLFGDIKESK